MNPETDLDMESLRGWIGRGETFRDTLTLRLAEGFQALIDPESEPPKEGDPLAPGGHWVLFPFIPAKGELGADGHPVRGGFLPPVPLPRRMWAGGRLEFLGQLRVGDAVERRSEITDVACKEGRSGQMVFVSIRHEISGMDGPAIIEDQDVVFRGAPDPKIPEPEPEQAPEQTTGAAAWKRTVTPGPVMLFRYSALTYNGHRIHYDREFAVNEEGYPGLVVHGPLTATLLMDLCSREQPDAKLRSFSFRATAPLFDAAPFTIAGAPSADGTTAKLWAAGPDGGLALKAGAVFTG